MSDSINVPVLGPLFQEAQTYTTLENIERYMESGGQLKALPVQPLYLAFKALSPEQVAGYLPALSQEQRQAMQDLDLWDKDQLDVAHFGHWVQAFAACQDDAVRTEFVKGESFALYLKGAFNIWTFDAEDPQYPDHDNYFLTEDNQLLFEFHENFPYLDEVRGLVRDIYSAMGVENAYAHLFKIVPDTLSEVQEEEYRFKKGRLEDLGFVDYYDSLEYESAFPKMEALLTYLKGKRLRSMTPELPDSARAQALHQSAVNPYRNTLGALAEELAKVKSEKRREFLHFNFIRLVNARLAFNHALKEGQVAIHQAGKKAVGMMLLGMDFLRVRAEDVGGLTDEGVFAHFDFIDLYRIGNTLVQIQQRVLKRALKESGFEELEQQAFLGGLWNELLDSIFEEPVRVPTRD